MHLEEVKISAHMSTSGTMSIASRGSNQFTPSSYTFESQTEPQNEKFKSAGCPSMPIRVSVIFADSNPPGKDVELTEEEKLEVRENLIPFQWK